MINYKKKDFDNPPAILINNTRLDALRLAILNLDGENIKSNHYNIKQVTDLLRAYSLNKDVYDENIDQAKCYYCESTTEVVASLQVEHYRPKKAIHEANRRLAPNTHGYYWLGIEWTNLVLSCPKCNGRGAKGNIFTISGTRIHNGTAFNNQNVYDRTTNRADLAPLNNERPDLLHPEIDNAYRYLNFDKLGNISHKLRRGQRTIEICKLDRPQLKRERYKLIDKFQCSFLEAQAWAEEDDTITDEQLINILTKKCRDLRKAYNKERAYTLLSRYMIEDFEDFFVNELLPRYQPLLRQSMINSNN